MRCANISIYDVFELNRVLHVILRQQSSYNIKTAYSIYKLTKWLDETEDFLIARMKSVLGTETIDPENQIHAAFLLTVIPMFETDLTIEMILGAEGNVSVDVGDIAILEKILPKTQE